MEQSSVAWLRGGRGRPRRREGGRRLTAAGRRGTSAGLREAPRRNQTALSPRRGRRARTGKRRRSGRVMVKPCATAHPDSVASAGQEGRDGVPWRRGEGEEMT